VQNLLYSSLLSKSVNIKIHRTIDLLVVLYCGENWSFIIREECRQSVFENWVLRRIFGPRRDGVTGSGKDYIMRSFRLCIPHQISLQRTNKKD
jgi:hypothetical protein